MRRLTLGAAAVGILALGGCTGSASSSEPVDWLVQVEFQGARTGGLGFEACQRSRMRDSTPLVVRNAEGTEVATGTVVRAPIPGDICRLEALVTDVPPSDTYELLTGEGWRVGSLSRPADRDGCATVDVIVIEGDLAVVDQQRPPEEQFAETCVLRGGST